MSNRLNIKWRATNTKFASTKGDTQVGIPLGSISMVWGEGNDL